jgi:hypothetical protein
VMLNDLEPQVAAREALTSSDAERVLACSDLVRVGVLGETARKAHHGDRVTFVQVHPVDDPSATAAADPGDAGEVRVSAVPTTWDAAVEMVTSAGAIAGTRPVTGFAADQLLDLAGGDLRALVEGARRLRAAGLVAVASLPLDLVENASDVIKALQDAGVACWRAVIDRAETLDTRLAMITRAVQVQRDTQAFKALAPLPVHDAIETPSTGYDDVRTIAVARLVATSIPSIQVDWRIYGPKLAQVAIAYGADDIDAVPATDAVGLGPRRSPREDMERQIRAAFASPAVRSGRFELIG